MKLFLHKCIRITIWINQDGFFCYYNFLIMPLSQKIRDINDKLYVIITVYSSFKISIDIVTRIVILESGISSWIARGF